MLQILEKISAAPVGSEIDHVIALVNGLRPQKSEAPELAITNVRTLTHLLQQHPHHAATLRHHLLHLLSVRRQTSLYTDIGILSNDGFFSELHRRLAYRVLPPALDDDH